MSITTVCSLFLVVCAAPVAAIAQTPSAAEIGFHYAYNSVSLSNEYGAGVILNIF
jgi:hypothetical protein